MSVFNLNITDEVVAIEGKVLFDLHSDKYAPPGTVVKLAMSFLNSVHSPIEQERVRSLGTEEE